MEEPRDMEESLIQDIEKATGMLKTTRNRNAKSFAKTLQEASDLRTRLVVVRGKLETVEKLAGEIQSITSQIEGIMTRLDAEDNGELVDGDECCERCKSFGIRCIHRKRKPMGKSLQDVSSRLAGSGHKKVQEMVSTEGTDGPAVPASDHNAQG